MLPYLLRINKCEITRLAKEKEKKRVYNLLRLWFDDLVSRLILAHVDFSYLESDYRLYRGPELRLLFIVNYDSYDGIINDAVCLHMETGKKFLLRRDNQYHYQKKIKWATEYKFHQNAFELIDSSLAQPDFRVLPSLMAQSYYYRGASDISDFCQKCFPKLYLEPSPSTVAAFHDLYADSDDESDDSDDDWYSCQTDSCIMMFAKYSSPNYSDRFIVRRQSYLFVYELSDQEYDQFKRANVDRVQAGYTDMNIYDEEGNSVCQPNNPTGVVRWNNAMPQIDRFHEKVIGYCYQQELNVGNFGHKLS